MTNKDPVLELYNRGISAHDLRSSYVDDLLGDNPPEAPPMGPFEPVDSSPDGVSSVRFADVHGNHEWIIDVDTGADFDKATYTQHQIVLYHWSQGSYVEDDLCIQELDCAILDDPTAVQP